MTRKPTNRRRRTTRPQSEPAMIRGVIVAVLGALTALGVGWAAEVDRDTIAALSVALAAILPLLQGLWTRYAVTPRAAVVAQVTPDGQVVAGEAAVRTTGSPLPVNTAPGDGLPFVPWVAVDPNRLGPR